MLILRHRWIQEKVEAGEFELEYIKTNDQLADIFTKPLTHLQFERLRELIGVVSPAQKLEREC